MATLSSFWRFIQVEKLKNLENSVNLDINNPINQENTEHYLHDYIEGLNKLLEQLFNLHIKSNLSVMLMSYKKGTIKYPLNNSSHSLSFEKRIKEMKIDKDKLKRANEALYNFLETLFDDDILISIRETANLLHELNITIEKEKVIYSPFGVISSKSGISIKNAFVFSNTESIVVKDLTTDPNKGIISNKAEINGKNTELPTRLIYFVNGVSLKDYVDIRTQRVRDVYNEFASFYSKLSG